MLIDLYKNSKPFTYVLTLCTPKGTPIIELKEAYNIVYTAKFADIDELSFKIPKIIENPQTHEFENNPNFDLVKGKFLIHMKTNTFEKMFVIDKPAEEGGDIEFKQVTCMGREIELNKKYLRAFKGTRQLYKANQVYIASTIKNSKNVQILSPTNNSKTLGSTFNIVLNIKSAISDLAVYSGSYSSNQIEVSPTTNHVINFANPVISLTFEAVDYDVNVKINDETNYHIVPAGSMMYMDEFEINKITIKEAGVTYTYHALY